MRFRLPRWLRYMFKKKRVAEIPIQDPLEVVTPVEEPRIVVKPVDPPEKPPEKPNTGRLVKHRPKLRAFRGLSIHANNTPKGCPIEARQSWDDLIRPIVRLALDVPAEERPFYIMKTGGESPLTTAALDEIGERTDSGYSVIYTNKKLDPSGLRDDLEAMEAHGVKPLCIGYQNEPDLIGRLSAAEMHASISAMPKVLQELRDRFGVPYISAPGLASFKNAITDYGQVYQTLFSGIPDVAAKVHSYGRMRPESIKKGEFKKRLLHTQGLPSDALLILEESANAFARQGDMVPRDEVVGQQGADFIYAMILLGAQEDIAVGHFMLWHGFSPNDISHPEYGALRREKVAEAVQFFISNKGFGDITDLELADPKGKYLDASQLPPL